MSPPRADETRDLGGEAVRRRAFLRWASAVGAVLALDRGRFLDALAGASGVALADAAACATTNRSVHLVAGNGGLAWFQLLWPHVAVARANDPALAYHATGHAAPAPTDKPFVYAPESPFQRLGRERQVTALLAGLNETHTSQPVSAATLGVGVGMLAAVASIQRANPSLLPVVALEPIVYGTAPGAPGAARARGAEGMIEALACAATHVLSGPLDEAYTKALLGLAAVARRPGEPRDGRPVAAHVRRGSAAIAARLRPTAADEAAYGLSPDAPPALVELGRALAVTAKAFALGLTSCVVLPAFCDDPHDAFDDLRATTARVAGLGRILDAFFADCARATDPAGHGRPLVENVVLTVHGDTPKHPLVRRGWPDATPGDANWIYVVGGGHLKTGWFGGIGARGEIVGWDPATGDDVPGQSSRVTAEAAAAAVTLAVARGDMRRVHDFYRGPSIAGVRRA